MCLGIPGQIVELAGGGAYRATVDVGGVRREANTALIEDDEDIEVGNWVLIHVGFAMARIDEEEAQRTLELLRAFGSIYDDEISQMIKSS